MQTVHLIYTVLFIRFSLINSARISFAGEGFELSSNGTSSLLGNFDPFETDLNPSSTLDDLPANESDHPSDINETHLSQAGPSLELVDSHPHSHDDDNTSIIESARHALIQPSIDFLDAQLHDGHEHVHREKNRTEIEQDDEEEAAADLDDFQRWLKEQNQTDQLTRFLSLQKEVKRFHFDGTRELNEKLDRTIEELKSTKQRPNSDL